MSESNKEKGISDQTFAGSVQHPSTSFQLVNESGSGEPYAGLAYEVTDSDGLKYSGFLDSTGTGTVMNHFAGTLALTMTALYQGLGDYYQNLVTREHYPLKITELQVRAEQTRFLNKNGARTRHKPVPTHTQEAYCQIEVRDLVEHVSHLPPPVPSRFPLSETQRRNALGVCLTPECHTVLEVRPLRALRPLLSTDSAFSTLNLYQLALMATLSYCPFGQKPDEQPVTAPGISFELEPSVGNWFADRLALFQENWQISPEQAQPYYPLYEDVPYSRRMEIVPFDPSLYPANDPLWGAGQESPATLHFLDDTRAGGAQTDTQAFVTHSDELILIAVRGSSARPDFLRDVDAFQIPFEEGEGKVHRGFYEAAQQACTFVTEYLDKFHIRQKVLLCGHSLGGAIALILSQMLRCRQGFDYDVLLYTYGAPRAGDAVFVKGAESLVHYRMVNHNDPIPSLPATWMNTKSAVYGSGAVLSFVNAPVGLSVFAAGLANLTGDPYQHHGTLRHFMPVEFGRAEVSHLLWTPLCDTVTQHAASQALGQRNGLPERDGFLRQLIGMSQHYMEDSYIPGCWAALRRYQEALEGTSTLVTQREFDFVDQAFDRISKQLYVRGLSSSNRPDKYIQAHEHDDNVLRREVEKISRTRERLLSLKESVPSKEDVYGAFSRHPERLAESLERWMAHSENTRVEQLTMAPEPEVRTFSGDVTGAWA